MGSSATPTSRYRQLFPAIGLSLERLTASVPNDGHYYVLLNGEIRGRFRTKARALAVYRALVEESGYQPPPVKASVDPGQDVVERYMDELEAYWTESHKHARRGGRSMYRR